MGIDGVEEVKTDFVKIPDAIKAVYKYDGKEYVTIHDDYIFDGQVYDYPEQWEYIYKEGNYSCDCNKSLFIRQQCDPGFPEMTCGEKIEMVNLEKIDKGGKG